jgi:VCBS repeat protein
MRRARTTLVGACFAGTSICLGLACNALVGLSAPSDRVDSGPPTPSASHAGNDGASEGATKRDAATCPRPEFSPPMTFALASAPNSLATGDFNGDHVPDIVLANAQGGTVSVLLNDGKGSFGAPATFTAGSYPATVAAGDFNGDGKPDLAVTDDNSASLEIFFNLGYGKFGTPVVYRTGDGPNALVVADFENDGLVDIAVGNHLASTVSIFLNDGGDRRGTFHVEETDNAFIGMWGSLVGGGDFDGDGNTDLVVSTYFGNSIGILFNHGNGMFANPLNYYRVVSLPAAAAVADFNDDGELDLAVSNNGTDGTVSVLLNAGGGVFANSVSYNAGYGGNCGSIGVGDFNGDGKPDLAATSGNTVGVILGNGDGTFGAPTIFDDVGQGAGGLVVADFNGDGRPDVAVGQSNTVMILLNRCP